MDGDRRSSRRRGVRYCSNCGAGLEPSMNFCPDCGAAATTEPTRSTTAGADAAVEPERNRARRPDDTDRRRLEHRIARASREGWKLERDFGDRAVMVRRTFGSADEHLAVALVTVWFTMGIGNALWGAYRYVGDAERMVVGPDPVPDDEYRAPAAVGASETSTDGPSRRWRAAAGGWWLVAALVALLGLELATATASLVLFALAALFASLGASALPSVRRRLEARHSVSANGRVRSIDERSVVAPERPCAACAEPIGRGLERTYRREYCVLGVPLTAEEGRNYYCRRCADGSTPGTTDGATSERESAAANRIGSGSRPNADLEDGREPQPDSRPAADAETESESTRG